MFNIYQAFLISWKKFRNEKNHFMISISHRVYIILAWSVDHPIAYICIYTTTYVYDYNLLSSTDEHE